MPPPKANGDWIKATHVIYPSGGLDLCTLELMRNANFGVPWLFLVELSANTPPTNDVMFQLSTLTFRDYHACRWCGLSYSTDVPSLKFLMFQSYGGLFGHGLTILTFDRVFMSWASFLQILCSSVLNLSVRRGMDRQTDNDHRCIMPPPHRAGGIVMSKHWRWNIIILSSIVI